MIGVVIIYSRGVEKGGDKIWLQAAEGGSILMHSFRGGQNLSAQTKT